MKDETVLGSRLQMLLRSTAEEYEGRKKAILLISSDLSHFEDFYYTTELSENEKDSVSKTMKSFDNNIPVWNKKGNGFEQLKYEPRKYDLATDRPKLKQAGKAKEEKLEVTLTEHVYPKFKCRQQLKKCCFLQRSMHWLDLFGKNGEKLEARKLLIWDNFHHYCLK